MARESAPVRYLTTETTPRTPNRGTTQRPFAV